jgi:hypothetical protein
MFITAGPIVIPVDLSKHEDAEFSEIEIEAIKDLEGVIAAYRHSRLRIREGTVEGIEFEALDPKYRSASTVPPLREGRYPMMMNLML